MSTKIYYGYRFPEGKMATLKEIQAFVRKAQPVMQEYYENQLVRWYSIVAAGYLDLATVCETRQQYLRLGKDFGEELPKV